MILYLGSDGEKHQICLSTSAGAKKQAFLISAHNSCHVKNPRDRSKVSKLPPPKFSDSL